MSKSNIYSADRKTGRAKYDYEKIILDLQEKAKIDLGAAIALSELNQQITDPDYNILRRNPLIEILCKNHLVDRFGRIRPEVEEILLKQSITKTLSMKK